MGWVALWVACGVLGLLVLVVPAWRLWQVVRELGREVGRVSDSLSAATLRLDESAQALERRRPAAGRHR